MYVYRISVVLLRSVIKKYATLIIHCVTMLFPSSSRICAKRFGMCTWCVCACVCVWLLRVFSEEPRDATIDELSGTEEVFLIALDYMRGRGPAVTHQHTIRIHAAHACVHSHISMWFYVHRYTYTACFRHTTWMYYSLVDSKERARKHNGWRGNILTEWERSPRLTLNH